MALSDVINLNIARTAAQVSRQGFGIMLILGTTITNQWGNDRIRFYNTAAAMLLDGFTSSSPEYKEALAAFSQTVPVSQVAVGRRLTPVALVDDVHIATIADTTAYTVTIDGTACTFTSGSGATGTSIQTGLEAAINALTATHGMAATAGTGTDITLTASKAGISHVVTVTANLTVSTTTASVGVQSDLTDIQTANDTWYALVNTSTDADELMEGAIWIEASRKVQIIASSDANILVSSSTTDIAAKVKAKSYARTAVLYSADVADGPAAAWFGGLLSQTPGSATYKFKTLVGITADALTPTQYTNAKAKNCNVYTTVGGLGCTEEGVTGSGEYIDVIVGIDWLYANMQADVFQQLMNSPKIPFTDVGAGVIEQAIQNRLRLAVNAGILAASPAPTVTVPKVADVASSDKAARNFTGITFTGVLAGAVHKLTINGNVTT